MKATRVSALLKRPLTSIETENFDLYMRIANQTLESLVCTSLCDQEDPKVYDVRVGYRTLFTDIFTDIEEVRDKDGVLIEPSEYSVRQWDKRNASWYNSIVFKSRFDECDEEVSVSASWGFDTMPSDLQLVLAGLFDMVGRKKLSEANVQSKQVEDFKITLRADVDLDTTFKTMYGDTIAKYSQCEIANVQHGSVC